MKKEQSDAKKRLRKKMRVVDAKRHGNVVRYYLADDSVDLSEVWGDDWDDAPYEYNCSRVYNEFVTAVRDVAYPFDDIVVEPCDGEINSSFSRQDFKEKRVPFILIVPANVATKSAWYLTDWRAWCGCKEAKRIFFGDLMEPNGEFNPEAG